LNFFEDTPGNIAAPPSMPEIFYFDKFAEEEDNMFLNNDYNKEILEKRRKRWKWHKKFQIIIIKNIPLTIMILTIIKIIAIIWIKIIFSKIMWTNWIYVNTILIINLIQEIKIEEI